MKGIGFMNQYKNFDEQFERFLNDQMTLQEQEVFKKTYSKELIEIYEDEFFVQQVERFLKKQMSEDEEAAFKEFLNSDKDKLALAKLIARTISLIGPIKEEQDEKYEKAILETDDITRRRMVSEFLDRKKEEVADAAATGDEREVSNYCIDASRTLQPSETPKPSDEETPEQRVAEANVRQTHWLRIAAVVVIIIGVSWFGIDRYYTSRMAKNSETISQTIKLGYDYGNMFASIPMTPRSMSDSLATARLSSVFSNVQRGDSLPEAIEFLTNIHEGSSLERNSVYEDYDEYVAWYLAIAYLKMGDEDRATIVLEKLVKEHPDTPIAEKSSELLNKTKTIHLSVRGKMKGASVEGEGKLPKASKGLSKVSKGLSKVFKVLKHIR